MPEEDFVLAKKAGCVGWGIGVESGSEKIRFAMGKKITDEDLEWSVEQLLKNQILQKWLLMVGYPSETEEDFKLTLDLLKKYAPYAHTGLIEISATPTFSLLNHSPIMQNVKVREDLGLTHNLIDPNADKFWTSTKYTENTFPVRIRRWKEIRETIEILGYTWNRAAAIDNWVEEIDSLEKIYHNEKSKIIPITKI
jgi:tRNA A37 methylthiotransferase MiaB